MGWIDDLSTDWEREHPDLDTTAYPPLVRLARLSLLIESFQHAVLAPFELTPGDYGVLSALRRAGPPSQLRPSRLYGRLQRSSGGLTKMLKRLEDRSLVKRAPDPIDGRSSLVSLTKEGLELQDRAFRTFLAASRELLAPLSDAERGETERVLQRLLELFGEDASR